MRTRPRRRGALLGLCVPLALAVSACGGGAGTAGAGSAGPGTIVVGATLSLTGSLSALGVPVKDGYEREIADVNAAGGIAVGGTKKKLRLVVLDNRSDPGPASSQALRLVRQDHAAALLGSAGAQIILPVATVAEQAHVPFLTSQMPAEAFANGDRQGWKYSWDLFSDEKQQAAAAARALASVPGGTKVALFTDSEPDAVVERPLYTAAFKAAGLRVVGDYTFPEGTTDFSSSIARARAAGARLVAGQLSPAGGAALWKQLKSSGLRPKAAFLAGSSGGESSGDRERVPGGLAQGTLSDSSWNPGQASPGQLTRIAPTLGQQYAGSPDYGTAAVAYAVAQVLTGALARAGTANPGQLNTAIGETGSRTAAGLIRFSPSTHTAITPTSIIQWQNGKPAQVQPRAAGVTLAVPPAGIG